MVQTETETLVEWQRLWLCYSYCLHDLNVVTFDPHPPLFFSTYCCMCIWIDDKEKRGWIEFPVFKCLYCCLWSISQRVGVVLLELGTELLIFNVCVFLCVVFLSVPVIFKLINLQLLYIRYLWIWLICYEVFFYSVYLMTLSPFCSILKWVFSIKVLRATCLICFEYRNTQFSEPFSPLL